MAPPTDPYRTLGLSRDASLEEVKRAYRRLAKENHPDAAGPAALPRFLAIQAAYERLAGGGVGGPGGVASGARSAASRASAADPDRADATHRAYAGRSRRTRPPGTGPSRSKGGRTSSGSTTGTAGRPGTSGTSGTSTGGTAEDPASRTAPGAGGASSTGRRGRGKATLGSTSYDGAEAGPFEPDWGGASWYGTTSGTYWTINPKEYADPRKHGPEYQARARRAARAAAGGAATDHATSDLGVDPDVGTTEPGLAGATGAEADPSTDQAGPGRVGPEPTFTRADDPVHTTSSWWGSTADTRAGDRSAADRSAGDRAATDDVRRPPAPPRPASAPPPTAAPDSLPPDLGAAARQLGRALTDERSARGRWRVAQSVVGWLPIALGVGWAIGELTGCSRSAASCDGQDPWLAPFAVFLALLPLLLIPRLAALAAAGGIAVALVALPAAAILSATNDETLSTERSVLLGIVLLVAWVAGVAVAIVQRARSSPADPVPADGGRPVS